MVWTMIYYKHQTPNNQNNHIRDLKILEPKYFRIPQMADSK